MNLPKPAKAVLRTSNAQTRQPISGILAADNCEYKSAVIQDLQRSLNSARAAYEGELRRQGRTVMAGRTLTSRDCTCNEGDQCCCLPGWTCCNYDSRCCCQA
jgi:hypothetical protein